MKATAITGCGRVDDVLSTSPATVVWSTAEIEVSAGSASEDRRSGGGGYSTRYERGDLHICDAQPARRRARACGGARFRFCKRLARWRRRTCCAGPAHCQKPVPAKLCAVFCAKSRQAIPAIWACFGLCAVTAVGELAPEDMRARRGARLLPGWRRGVFNKAYDPTTAPGGIAKPHEGVFSAGAWRFASRRRGHYVAGAREECGQHACLARKNTGL